MKKIKINFKNILRKGVVVCLIGALQSLEVYELLHTNYIGNKNHHFDDCLGRSLINKLNLKKVLIQEEMKRGRDEIGTLKEDMNNKGGICRIYIRYKSNVSMLTPIIFLFFPLYIY